QAQAFALERCNQGHRHGGDDEAVGDRPFRRNHAELAPDHDPGRTPDGGEGDEWEDDGPEFGPAALAHRLAIAAASFSTDAVCWSQLVTNRISSGPHS